MLTIVLLSGASSILMSLAWGTYFFIHRKKIQASGTISLFYLCIALSLLKTFADNNQYLLLSRALYLVYPFTVLSIPIFFIFQVYLYTTHRKIPRRWYLVFLVPALLCLVSGYVFYLHYPQGSISTSYYAIINGEADESFKLAQTLHTITLKVFGVSLGGVMLIPVLFIPWLKTTGGSEFYRHPKAMRRLTVLFLISMVLCLATIIYHFSMTWRGFTQVIWFTGILLIGWLTYKSRVAKKKETFCYNEAELSALGKKLLAYFDNARPWSKSHLKITDVAGELGTNQHYISEVLNKEFHTNFNSFVNHYRVIEAVRLMNNADKRYNLVEVQELTGFNSYLTFYRAIKESTGMSPDQYLRRHCRRKSFVKKISRS
jgi:AraC-like DNA-binding protein